MNRVSAASAAGESIPIDRAELAHALKRPAGQEDRARSDARSVRKTRREELAAFLKSRRARIGPEEVGLPVGTRRRTPGLRREEVAQLAGVGVTWYTWLEQGRDINASVQVLDAISRTLCLDGAERAHLYRLADVQTIPSPHADGPVPDELQVILDHVDPLPAVLLSARYDVIAHNAAYAALCPLFTTNSKNVVRMVFLAPECCNPYPGDMEHKARMVGFLRGAYAKNLQDPLWTEFIDELAAASPLFAEMWARNDVAVPRGRSKVIRNIITGDVDMVVTSLSLPTIAGAWLQILTPSDEAGWTQLRTLVAMTPEERRQPWLAHFAQAHPGVSIS
ncbi:helix-turn-helix transcriptional regulator [Nocardia sp. NBC_01388]|uniref:helix-turn-helix transcriptional regulator n=1 Tax=Nocardia sp. NBC_01388 TaxID=2903596 RepID=UPI0032477CA0